MKPAVAAALLIAALSGCGDSGPQRIPLDVLALRSVEVDGERRAARAFTVLEPVVLDTGIPAAHGELQFSTRFQHDQNTSGSIAVQVGDRAIQTSTVASGEGWQNFRVQLPEDVPAALIELVIDGPGRYSLASLEFVAAPGAE